MSRIARAVMLAFALHHYCPNASAGLWTTAYYPGYEQAGMAASNIDFSALTHIIHFSLVPNTNGTLNWNANNITAAYSSDLISRAHAAGVKVLICVGGADTEAGFQSAATNANLTNFIANLTNFMTTRGYDGIDIDWEPLTAADAGLYTNLVNVLRSALNKLPGTHKLLTAAAAAYPVYGDPPAAEYAMFSSIQTNFDQINIMTYDLAGPYEGWITWFNSPIYDGGTRFPSTGALVPSVDGAVSNFTSNGVTASKLGIGIAFYGYIWTGGSGGTVPSGGVTAPRQSWTTAPSDSGLTYSTILSSQYQSNLYFWDTNAQAAYLSVSGSNNKFISYDDEHTCQAKVSYARNHGLGGVMVWELAQDFFGQLPANQSSPLLESIKYSLHTPGFSGVQLNGSNVWLTFSSLPLALYRIQWTSNITGGPWNTLTNNVPGTGQSVQVTDTNFIAQPGRYYRVKTPP